MFISCAFGPLYSHLTLLFLSLVAKFILSSSFFFLIYLSIPLTIQFDSPDSLSTIYTGFLSLEINLMLMINFFLVIYKSINTFTASLMFGLVAFMFLLVNFN